MKNKLIIAFIIIIIAILLFFVVSPKDNGTKENHWENNVGSVDKWIYGNPNSDTEIVIVVGMHPREKLAIEPEIEAVKEFAPTQNVKIILYHVNVTKNATDYQLSRANGERLVREFVVPDIEKTSAKAVIISHSHIKGYGEGFYLATPAMDNASVNIAKKIASTSSFNFIPTNTSTPLKATSAIYISKPLADAGYPTFVYEIPEDITEHDSTEKAKELLNLIYNIVSK